jgi:hypothetical protein
MSMQSAALVAALRIPIPELTTRLASAATEFDDIGSGECISQPGRGQIIQCDLGQSLEDLELVTRFIQPKRNDRFQRRTAWKPTRYFRDQDHRVCGKRETRARPLPHLLQGLGVFGIFVGKPTHCALLNAKL